MIAEYNKKYPCKKGTMPEDFENCIGHEYDNHAVTKLLILWYDDTPPTYVETDFRMKWPGIDEWKWRNAHNHKGCVAWMLPEPRDFNEQK